MLATGTQAFSPIEHTIVRYHVLAAQALERERNPLHADDKIIGQKWYGALARAAAQAVVKRRVENLQMDGVIGGRTRQSPVRPAVGGWRRAQGTTRDYLQTCWNAGMLECF